MSGDANDVMRDHGQPSGVGSSRAPSPRPGPELAALLASVDSATLDDHDLLDHVAQWEALAAWVARRQLAAVADFARRPARVARPGEDRAAASATWSPVGRAVREFADDEIAATLHVSRQDAASRLATGCALVAMPATAAALDDGRIDLRRVRVLIDETRALDPSTAREVEAALIGRAEHLSAGRLRPIARRAAVAADPVAAGRRETEARHERRVVVTPQPDGMAELWALLPAADAMAIKTAITAAARASHRAAEPGDDRTMDQRTADALTAPFLHALSTGELAGTGTRLARHRGEAARLQVTVSAETLLGVSDDPAELAGYGPISAGAARELAPDARWQRVLTNPVDGTVLDVGRTSYRPPAALDRHVKARSARCAFPGCGWSAESCDLDHVVPFPHGPTADHNLEPLCRRHHRLKQAPGVSVERTSDGWVRWTLPTGHVHETRPDPRGRRRPPDHAA